VEDNPTNRKVLQKILERAGHQCVMANDGEMALDMIAVQHFDAMVIDMNMPKLSGLEVVRFCRLMGGSAATTPIIVFSASVTQEARDESFAAGANAFIPKPIEVQKFLQTLNQLVQANNVHSDRPQFLHSLDSAPHTANQRSGSDAPVLLQASLPSAASILDATKLNNLQAMSQDPVFVNDLITEFISEGERLIGNVGRSLRRADYGQVASAMHALRGSALSIGADALKQLCTHFEKMTDEAMSANQVEIQRTLEEAFQQLCDELASYQYRQLHQRIQVI
jgi:two-component system sensor histidine kinase RpfC